MTRTTTQIVTAAYRRFGLLDAVEACPAELLADGIAIGSEMLDSWREERLTIGGITISTYSLASGQASRTIGSGGDFSQTWPADIVSWSVIPDDDAAHPLEIPMGRPRPYEEWQLVRIKTQTGAYPTKMYWDRSYAAGLGNLYFHPIPDNADVDVKLYQRVPAITQLTAGASYDLRPGYMLALISNLAVLLADANGREVSPKLDQIATKSLGTIKRANIHLRQSPIRPEFAIGTRRRSFNVKTGGA